MCMCAAHASVSRHLFAGSPRHLYLHRLGCTVHGAMRMPRCWAGVDPTLGEWEFRWSGH